MLDGLEPEQVGTGTGGFPVRYGSATSLRNRAEALGSNP